MAAMAQLTFTQVAGSGADASNVALVKDGGCAFADYDLDGDLDLVVNTNDNSATGRSYLLRNDNGVFTDVTNAVASGLKSDEKTERTAAWGDCNNDGYPDLLLNYFQRLKILINNGGASFTLHTNMTTITDGMNTEGAGWLDYDNDGDLDFFVENHAFGLDLFQNDGSTPNPVFTHVTANAVGAVGSGAGGLGLPEGGSTEGDYATCSDLNQDGYVDITARRRNDGTNNGLDQNPYDIFLHQGNGTYAPLTTFNEEGLNSNKGSVVPADLDNDGDFDLLWTSSSTDANRNVVYENTGNNSMVFVLVPNPFLLQNGVSPENSTDFDGAAVGDIDNDGDLDVFITQNSGTSKLFLNQSTGPGNFSFRQPGPLWISGAAINYGINVNGNGEGCVMVDYDNDGDLDIYVNRDNANQLWQNNYIGSVTEAAAPYQNNYLRVIAYKDQGGGVQSIASNAVVKLLDCAGNELGGAREVGAGGSGHGAQTSPWLHFGLPNGPDNTYLVEIQFTRNGTTPVIVRKAVVPSALPILSAGSSTLELEQTVVIKDTDLDQVYYCLDSDGDAVYDHADLDDDNDGIPDFEENTATSTSYQPPCNTTVLDFSGPPVLISGGALLDGAMYKYTGVNGTIDALVTIQELFNTTVPTIDDNSADATYFKPRSAFNLATIGDQAYTEYKFEFVTGVSQTPVIIPEIFINFNDIDGNTSYSEENWASYPVSYSIDNPTQLTLTVNGWILGTGSTTDMPGSSNANPDVNYTVRYLNISELSIRVGAIARVAGANNGGRQHSIEFACVSNYVDPVTYYIDYDEDGVINMLDLDSDNDGIYDLFEAGHSEADLNNDGIIDGTPTAFGTNGLFDMVETVADNGILNYPISDSDLDGNIDAQELDSDNDGCNDVIEAGFTDSNSDGTPGPAPIVVDGNGSVTSLGP